MSGVHMAAFQSRSISPGVTARQIARPLCVWTLSRGLDQPLLGHTQDRLRYRANSACNWR